MLAACGFIAAQYAFLQIFGLYSVPLAVATGSSVGTLYEAMNWGACALAFLAGLAFDACGPAGASLLGGGLSTAGLAVALACFRAGVGSSWLVVAGYLAFGLGASCFNTVAVLAAVRVVPARHAGKASAGVLCFLALGMSAHTAVYARWFPGDPLGFLGYQMIYSALCGALGLLVFGSRRGRLALGVEQAGEAGDGREDGPSSGKRGGLLARVRRILMVKEMPWLAALFLVPLSYSFALLGMWSQCAECLAVPGQHQTRLALGLGVSSALGRVVLGGLADAAGDRGRKLNWELCCAAGLLAFQLGFAALEWDQRGCLGPALWLQSFGYGGVLALAPAALRRCFPARDLGLVYGLLYQVLAVSFTVFNRTAVPSPGCVGAECFRGWFRIAGMLNALMLVWCITRCLALSERYFRRNQPDQTLPAA